MATPITHLLSFFLLFSIFHCTLSLLDPQDDVGFLVEPDDVNIVQNNRNSSKRCDFSVGKWVYDESYPLYDPNCPYLSTAVTCQKNGRPDSDYEKWKWKPSGCSIPRFDALKFLGKMRRKRIMLVGDSIMRNQWESLVCLVQGVIPTGRKRVTYHGPAMAFHSMDFETSIEFLWAPLLVELKKSPENKRVLHLDLIEENAKYWRGVDILVFDSAQWWTHSDKTSSWDYYKEGSNLIKNMSLMVAYQKGLSTWARWVDLNLNPQKTKVIFRSMSPRHNRENGWKCDNQKQPLPFFSLQQHAPEPLVVLQGVLKKMRFPVYLQDITTMTALRRDGHPSVYRKATSQDEKQRMGHSSDCSHWCLPGVPDIWNEMLSALL
ncbi:putative PMR5 domain, PC-Esterase [Medicago truncatula]|uniref:Pmr5/Cas1p GDSL/SGNH-like acyl-esterase family protein n=2 Tax=Medicago truncatula TaxID=3880 RepID=A0A072VTJ0_MEDTR|nr:protein trichome birefringence-like 36 [Medicago truncatula]KEH41400.1 Pmr5/Cas1p GDSL/SGNH-like acyl-esterase family protein [Medicago truncatula]RHN78919.1 putative PMR5 domain, PC-Esterase [Medicago truncatula]